MAAAKKKQELVIPPLKKIRTTIHLGGDVMVTHRFSEKARKQILDTKMHRAKEKRQPCDPQQEFEAAKYKDRKGREGFPCSALRNAIIDSGSFVDGITKVQIRGAVFVKQTDKDALSAEGLGLVLFDGNQKGVMREDIVRVANGAPDLRFRPEYRNWSASVEIEFDPDILSAEQVHHLIQRAGFAIGIGESRPQKGGDWGQFDIRTAAVKRMPVKKSKAA